MYSIESAIEPAEGAARQHPGRAVRHGQLVDEGDAPRRALVAVDLEGAVSDADLEHGEARGRAAVQQHVHLAALCVPALEAQPVV